MINQRSLRRVERDAEAKFVCSAWEATSSATVAADTGLPRCSRATPSGFRPAELLGRLRNSGWIVRLNSMPGPLWTAGQISKRNHPLSPRMGESG